MSASIIPEATGPHRVFICLRRCCSACIESFVSVTKETLIIAVYTLRKRYVRDAPTHFSTSEIAHVNGEFLSLRRG